jgi:peptidoglycan L-alanyl-D-glutamate endopeptidase CwlK
MSDRDSSHLHIPLRERVDRLIFTMDRIGFIVMVTDGWRSRADQEEFWKQGRDRDGNIIDKRRVVTYARPGTSAHEVMRYDADGTPFPCAMAVDLAFVRNGAPTWAEDMPWGVLGTVATEICGLEWGGNFKNFKDKPHVQMPSWKGIAQSFGWLT